MKKTIPLGIMATLLLCGCVSRTTTSEPTISDLQRGKGFNANDKIVEKKLIWIWQDEYRNQK